MESANFETEYGVYSCLEMDNGKKVVKNFLLQYLKKRNSVVVLCAGKKRRGVL